MIENATVVKKLAEQEFAARHQEIREAKLLAKGREASCMA